MMFHCYQQTELKEKLDKIESRQRSLETELGEMKAIIGDFLSLLKDSVSPKSGE